MERLSLREFIDKREAEIKSLMILLKQELKELKAARSAISEQLPPTKSSDTREPLDGSAQKTIKDMAIAVLGAHGGSGTAEDIVGWIKDEFHKDIERSSLSPQLSRLKSEGRLELDATIGRWLLSPTRKSEESRLDSELAEVQTSEIEGSALREDDLL